MRVCRVSVDDELFFGVIENDAVALLTGHPFGDFAPEGRVLRLSDVRRAVASVSQDVQIFPETVRFNIGLGDPKLTDEKLMSAAELVCADTLIRGLPGGLDGYRQRDDQQPGGSV